LASGDVDDLRRRQPILERSVAAQQHLVEPDRHGLADPVRVVDQRSTVLVHGVHHRVSVAAEISRYF